MKKAGPDAALLADQDQILTQKTKIAKAQAQVAMMSRGLVAEVGLARLLVIIQNHHLGALLRSILTTTKTSVRIRRILSGCAET